METEKNVCFKYNQLKASTYSSAGADTKQHLETNRNYPADSWTKTYNSCLCVHKACQSLDKQRPGMSLCAVGGTTSNRMLKGVDRWERPRDVYTGREELGVLAATEECQSSVCFSFSHLRLSLWVEKICLTPFSLLPEKEETVKWMTWLNRWSQWSVRNVWALRGSRVKTGVVWNVCVI